MTEKVTELRRVTLLVDSRLELDLSKRPGQECYAKQLHEYGRECSLRKLPCQEWNQQTAGTWKSWRADFLLDAVCQWRWTPPWCHLCTLTESSTPTLDEKPA